MLYRGATPELLSDTHSGLVGLNARPQEFCRFRSTTWAPWLLRSEMRLVWWNSFPGPDARAGPLGSAMAAATAAGTPSASARAVPELAAGQQIGRPLRDLGGPAHPGREHLGSRGRIFNLEGALPLNRSRVAGNASPGATMSVGGGTASDRLGNGPSGTAVLNY